MRSNVSAVSSSWHRPALESAALALLLASLIFTVGRARYEAATTFSIDDISAMGASAAAQSHSPPAIAKQLLQRALQHANDPPAPEPGMPREFRVDVLRNHGLVLFCEAERRVVAEELCNRIAKDVTAAARELRVIEPARASLLLKRRFFDAAWPALLAGVGWLLVRTSRRRERGAEAAANPVEWEWSVPRQRSATPTVQLTAASATRVAQVSSPRNDVQAARRPLRILKTMVGMPAVAAPATLDAVSATDAVAASNMNSVFGTNMQADSVSASGSRSEPVRRSQGAGISGHPAVQHTSSPLHPPQARARRAAASGPDLSTRVIYHVASGPWSGDAIVLTQAALDELRGLIDELFRDPKAGCRVVRIASSANSRYAKSQVAAQLAWLLAERKDKRILLAEADLDAPVLHKVLRLNVPRGFGFSEQLDRMGDHANGHNEVTLLRIAPQLHVLVEGSLGGAPALFDSPQFAAALTEQRNAHDVIVLDGPVVDEWSDAQMIRDVSDGVVFVVASGTPLAEAKKVSAKHFESQRLLRTVKTGEWPNA